MCRGPVSEMWRLRAADSGRGRLVRRRGRRECRHGAWRADCGVDGGGARRRLGGRPLDGAALPGVGAPRGKRSPGAAWRRLRARRLRGARRVECAVAQRRLRRGAHPQRAWARRVTRRGKGELAAIHRGVVHHRRRLLAGRSARRPAGALGALRGRLDSHHVALRERGGVVLGSLSHHGIRWVVCAFNKVQMHTAAALQLRLGKALAQRRQLAQQVLVDQAPGTSARGGGGH